MADLYIPDGYAQGFIRWRAADDPEEMVCTIGLKQTAIDDTAQLMADDLDDVCQLAGSLADPAKINDEYSYVGTKVILHTAGGLDVGQVDDVVAGTAVGDGLVNNAAILVKKITASAGRWGRGRMFLPPCYTNNDVVTANGMISSVAVGQIQDILDVFLAGFAAVDEIDGPYLLHYPRTDPPSPSPDPTPDPTLITALTVQPKLATIRRRLRP